MQGSLFNLAPFAAIAPCPARGERMDPAPVGLLIRPAHPTSCGVDFGPLECVWDGGWDDCPRRERITE